MTSAGGLSGTEESERGGQCEGWEGIGGPGGCGLLGLGHQGSELGKKMQRSEGVSAIRVLQGLWLLNDKVWGCGNGPELRQRTRSWGGTGQGVGVSCLVTAVASTWEPGACILRN